MDIQKLNIEQIQLSGTNPRKYFSNESIEELAQSIKKNGLIQPITVRPITPDQRSAKNNEMIAFELVAGERRLRASEKANLEYIDAIVREMNDEEAFDIQVVENLQRENVHPLDEADGFARMLDSDRYTVSEIAKRMGKSSTFVTRRLKLQDLIDDLRRLFYEDKILLGHAVELCRLSEADQREVYEQYWGNEYGLREPTVGQLRQYIENRVIRELTSAPFSPEDESLYPEAGACTSCPKRSGANLNLFPDIKEHDRCFDSSCYERKTRLELDKKVKNVIHGGNENIYLSKISYSDDNQEMIEDLEKMGHTVLTNYDDFTKIYDEEESKVARVKVLWLNGNDIGTISGVQLNKKAAESGDVELAADQQIQEIEQKEARAVELDREKVIRQLPDVFEASESFNDPEQARHLDEYEIVLTIWFMMYEELGWPLQKEMKAELFDHIEVNEDGYLNEDLSAVELITEIRKVYNTVDLLWDEIRRLTRLVVKDTFFSGTYQDPQKYVKPYLYLAFALCHEPSKVTAIQNELVEKAKERKQRVAEKIESVTAGAEPVEA